MQAIWLIVYEIAADNRERYLEWFHEVHIPEKLARTGYTWAAHYQVLHRDGGETASGDAPGDAPGDAFVALFGAETSRVLHNPSPGQIKPNQTPVTRAMMALRDHSSMGILLEEWQCGGLAACGQCISHEVNAPVVHLDCINAPDNDEELQAWYAQSQAPRIASSDGCMAVHKWRTSSGNIGHALLQQFQSAEACLNANRSNYADEWGQRIAAFIKRPAGKSRIGKRIWPPQD